MQLATITREEAGHILEGVLHCPQAECQREFPIIDGVPLIVANLRQYVADNLVALIARGDLTETTESILGDCCGPGSIWDIQRQHLSSYVWDHYADRDPQEPTTRPRPGSLLTHVAAGCELAAPVPAGPILDIGCAAGRATLALAAGHADLVLGVDLNFSLLRVACEVLRYGRVRYPRRRVGVVYDRREFPAEFAHREQVDFWACDALALPFAAGTFALSVGLNVLDCVTAPAQFLAEVAQALRRGGRLVLTCPYDWAPGATPLEGWLGGHSQRGALAGSSAAVLRLWLTPGDHPQWLRELELKAEQDDLPWHVRLHERSTMTYRLHLVVATRV